MFFSFLILDRKTDTTQTKPEARTEEYYKKRPCVELVGQAAEILERVLLNKDTVQE